MSDQNTKIAKRIYISEGHAKNLSFFAHSKSLSEDQVIEKALDILFSLADIFGVQTERQGWSILSDASLERVWDNLEDASYDNWRELYGLSKG